MKTPWGELPVRDAHIHFLSANFFSLLAAQKPGLEAASLPAQLGWTTPDPDAAAFGRTWAEELDRHQVDSAVLMASLPGDDTSVASALAAYPGRFHGYFLLNPLAPDSLQIVNRALGAGLQGVCLFPAMHRYSLHDERVRPVLDAAAAHRNAVVFVHCGVLTVGFRKKLGLPSQFDMRFSNPVDVHGIALQYPQMPFVIPHFGAGYFREALMVCDLCPNVYLDTSSSNEWRRYQPPEISLADIFRRAIAVTGTERLLFGTDSSFFPRGWNRSLFEAQVIALQTIGTSRKEAEGIFGGNLLQLLHRG